MYYTLTLWKLFDSEQNEQEMTMKRGIVWGTGLLFFASVFSFVLLPSFLEPSLANLPVGLMTLVLHVSFIGSPLLILGKVIKEKNSNLLHFGFTIATILMGSGSFIYELTLLGWSAYGLVLMDWFIIVPDVISLGMSLACRLLFPAIYTNGGVCGILMSN
jgi:hypothetical protein